MDQAATEAVNATQYQQLAKEARKRVLMRYKRATANQVVRAAINKVMRDYDNPDFDLSVKHRELKLKQFEVIRGAVDQLVEDAVGAYDPDSPELNVDMKTHFNRAAFYAQDQMGGMFGELQSTMAQSTGAAGYVWLRTSSANPRDKHLSRVGKFFRFGEVSDPPGTLYNCKCGMQPVYSHEDMP